MQDGRLCRRSPKGSEKLTDSPALPSDTLPRALESLDEITRWLAGRRIAVFLDYDGTLTPTVDHPEKAILSDSARAAVEALAQCCPVAVISGRDREDVQRRVGLDSLIYAGSHGFDIAGPDTTPDTTPNTTPNTTQVRRREGVQFADLLGRVEADLTRLLDGIDGALIEPKAASVAVHYRLVAEESVGTVKAAVETVVADHDELRVTPGKKVLEIQPRLDWDKGAAVVWLLDTLGLDGDDVAPIYMGDDVTDEDAFRALKGRGVGILVEGGTARPSAADYRVATPGEGERLLAFLADYCRGLAS